MKNRTNQLLLSVTSVWEMQIKAQLGKLTLTKPLATIVEHQVTRNGLGVVSIELSHIYALQLLPLHHRDPFDRMIIAQATVGGMTIVTVDRAFSSYAVPVLW